jgi:hypothetical protein
VNTSRYPLQVLPTQCWRFHQCYKCPLPDTHFKCYLHNAGGFINVTNVHFPIPTSSVTYTMLEVSSMSRLSFPKNMVDSKNGWKWQTHFSFGHFIVCSSSIYGFWLPLWYLRTKQYIAHVFTLFVFVYV